MIKNLLIGSGDPITPELRAKLPENFTNPFSYSPHPLCKDAMSQVCSYLRSLPSDISSSLLEDGKMFGVLVVESANGELGFLAAYSGNLDWGKGCGYFVPPVYDLTSAESFFPEQEKEIVMMNDFISDLSNANCLGECKGAIEELEEFHSRIIRELEQEYEDGRQKRDALRRAGASDDELAALVKESQFQKGEIRRAKKRMNEELAPIKREYEEHLRSIETVKRERRQMSADLQMKIFDHFSFLNARGQEKSLLQIFGGTMPPAGAGECAAPRLLQYAYSHSYRPLAMGEFWYGASTLGRHSLTFYPSCKGKCGPILGHMLKGLRVDQSNFHTSYGKATLPNNYIPTIIYEDDLILAVEKPQGVLSVPGKDPSEPDMLQLLHNAGNVSDMETPLLPVHRLDMHTSGILLFAKDEATYKFLQRQFALHKVEKCYKAVLDGVVCRGSTGSGVLWKGDKEGEISLPLSPDYMNRPLQCVDYETGKPALTRFRITGVENGATCIDFYPVTGRTHQLRVHSAHKDGLGVPIAGDLLYGRVAKRLMLHACSIKFTHPREGEMYLHSTIPLFA